MRSRNRLVHLVLLALAGCQVSLPWSSAGGDAALASRAPVSPAAVALRAWAHGGQPEPQRIAYGGPLDGVYLSLDVGGTPLEAVRDDRPGSRGFLITGIPPDEAGQGIHTGRVMLSARWNATGVHVPGSPWAIPFSYEVGPAALDGLPPSVTLDQIHGGPAPEPVILTVDGAPDAGPWTVEVVRSTTAPPWLQATPEAGSATPAQISLTVLRPPADSVWVEQAYLRLSRADQVVELPVERRQRYPWLQVDATPIALAIEADQGERPAFAIHAETEAGALARCVVAVAYDPPIPWGQTGWLQYSWSFLAPGDVPFQLATTALAPGRHTATVTLTGEFAGTAPPVVVSLDVSAPPATLAPTAHTFRLGAAATPASLQQPLVLTSLGDQVDWTASADVPWLRVTPAGSTPAGGASTLTVEIVPEALEALRCRWAKGAVTVSATARGGRAYEYRAEVALELDLPCLVGAGPSFDVEGVPAELALVGLRCDQATVVQVGDVAVPVDPARALWGELRLALPPLPAGIYRVTVPTSLGIALGSATYRVAAPRRPAATALAAPGRKSRLVFDEVLGALWSVNTTTSEVERWDEAAGWTRHSQAITGLKDAVPLPDGATWLALAGAELSTFEVATFPSAVPLHWGWALDRHASLAAPIDGHVLLAADPVTCVYAECQTNAWDPVTRGMAEFGSQPGARLGGSRSGLRMAIAEDNSLNARRMAFWWAGYLSFGAGGPLPLGGFTYGVFDTVSPQQLALDRHGDRVLLLRDGSAGAGQSQLLDSAGQVLPGRLPATIAKALLTQPGDRAVAFDGVSRKIRIFDVNGAPDPSTGFLPELGPPGGFTPAGDPGPGLVLALSADDRTLFVGGDERIVVVPLP